MKNCNTEEMAGAVLLQAVTGMSGCENFEPQLGTVATTTPTPVACGNGILEMAEQCDDGNLQSLDGCDGTCLAERPVCGDGIKISNAFSFDWSTEPPTLIPDVIFSESCDDGNSITGDGCDAECEVELGWSCFVPVLPAGNLKSSCITMCGNGNVDTEGSLAESCDDYNRNDGDGCSSWCLIECGFNCRRQGGTSICQSTCGDSIKASDEECEGSSTDNRLACDVSQCKLKRGWQCSDIKCELTLNGLTKQECKPVCGDRVVISPFEICDAGAGFQFGVNDGQDWPRPWTGGNGPDRWCNDLCKPNRDFQCFGGTCASRQAPDFTPQDLSMSLLDMMLDGNNLHQLAGHPDPTKLKKLSSTIEGLMLSRDIRKSESSQDFVGKRFLFDTTSVGDPKTYRGIVTASFANDIVKVDENSKVFRCSTCYGDTMVTARRVEISGHNSTGVLAFDSNCSWTLRPLDALDGRMLMNVSSLDLGQDELLEFDQWDTQTQEWIILLSLQGPLKYQDLGLGSNYDINVTTINGTKIETRIMSWDTHFDLPLNVRIRYSAAPFPQATESLKVNFTDKREHRFHVHLIPSMDQLSIGSKYALGVGMQHMDMTFSRNRTHKVAPFARGASQPSSLPPRYAHRREIMNMQGYAAHGLPCDFAQHYNSITLPMESEGDRHRCSTRSPAYCEDQVQPDLLYESDAPRFYEGSWEGKCVNLIEQVYDNCKVFLRISGIDVEQHITGEGCPANWKGRKIGLIKVLIKSPQFVPVFDPAQQLVMLFSEIFIKWTHTATELEGERWITGIMSTGPRAYRSPTDNLKMLLSEPGISAWPSGESLLATSIPGCLSTHYEPVLPATIFKLPPYLGTDPFVAQKAKLHQRIAFEVRHIITCNASIAKIQKLSDESLSCKRLVHVLFLRDPLQMLPASASGNLCKEICKADFLQAVEEAIEVCGSAWPQKWVMSSYHGILFKQLVTVAAFRYWMNLDCATNRHFRTCVSVAQMSSHFLIGAEIQKLQDTCLAFQGKFLPPAHSFDFNNSVAKNEPFKEICSITCKASLDNFVKDRHCCVSSVEDQDKLFFNVIRHRYLEYIHADLRDRESPYALGDPEVLTKYLLAPNAELAAANINPDIPWNRSISDCPSSRVAASCAQEYYCGSLNWQPSCCDELMCARGNKLYPGACSCMCPTGWSGQICDSKEVFLSFEVTFPDETLDTFGIGKIREYAIDLSKALNVKTSEIEWEEPMQGLARRKQHVANRKLLVSQVRVLFRISQPTFQDVDEVRKNAITAMCDPDYKYQMDFSCEYGPAVFYNATRLNPIPIPPSPPPSPTPPPPPRPVEDPPWRFKFNILAFIIILCSICFILVVSLIYIRIKTERTAQTLYLTKQISFSEYWCLILCFRTQPANRHSELENYIFTHGTEFKANSHRTVQVMHMKGKKKNKLGRFDDRGRPLARDEKARGTHGNPNQPLDGHEQDGLAESDSMSDAQEVEQKDAYLNESGKMVEMLKKLNQIKKLQHPASASNVLGPKNLYGRPLSPKDHAGGVELSTQAHLKYVGQAIQFDKSILSTLSPRQDASQDLFSGKTSFRGGSPFTHADSAKNAEKIIGSTQGDIEMPTVLEFNATGRLSVDNYQLQNGVGSSARGSGPGFVKRTIAPSPHGFNCETPPPMAATAELGFTPVEFTSALHASRREYPRLMSSNANAIALRVAHRRPLTTGNGDRTGELVNSVYENGEEPEHWLQQNINRPSTPPQPEFVHAEAIRKKHLSGGTFKPSTTASAGDDLYILPKREARLGSVYKPINDLVEWELLHKLANPEAINQGFGSSRMSLTSPMPTNRMYQAASPNGAMSARSEVSAADSLLGSVNKHLAKRVDVDYEARKATHHEKMSTNIRRHVDL